MPFTLRLLGVTVLNLEACDDCTCTDDPPPSRPPFGFAGSGPGVLHLSDDRDLDSLETYDRRG